jgi:V/A-type H+/Na+-transporting ATPase subunit E
MKTLEKGSERVKKICDAIKLETIEPALEEARQIIETAKEDAAKILGEAHQKAESLLKNARAEIAKEKHVFEASLHQASCQAIESFKQAIEKDFFQPSLKALIGKGLDEASVLARLIEAIISSVEKEGLAVDFSLSISKKISSHDLAMLVAQKIIENFSEKKVAISGITGGVMIHLGKDNLTIDMSDKMLAEMLGEYIRKDLRQIFFKDLK